jgi:hypothetical protein
MKKAENRRYAALKLLAGERPAFGNSGYSKNLA